MVTWKWLKGELAVAEHLIGCGDAGRALERLSFLLAQYDQADAAFGLHRANILHLMGKAATSLNDIEGAEKFYLEGIEILDCSDGVAASEQADFYMSLAEHFAGRRLQTEAIHFGDVALEFVMADNGTLEKEESAELLRRYAWVSEMSGAFPAAYLALSLGLLVVHEASGMESEVAQNLAALANRVCSVQTPKTIQQVGKYVVAQLKLREAGGTAH